VSGRPAYTRDCSKPDGPNGFSALWLIAFVTKLSGRDGNAEATEPRDFSIKTPENSISRRISASYSASRMAEEEYDEAQDADSEGSSGSSELFEFDVYEREGYDKIIQTVAGAEQG
jgi:hypothetical protein